MDRKVYEFISKATSDPIVERKICRRTGREFPIFAKDKELLDKISPRIGNQKFKLPTPTLSREARRRRRLMRRNDRKLYKTTCKITGKSLVTIYHPEIEKNIIEESQRHKLLPNNNKGFDFDFSQTLNEQIGKLMKQTIKQNILTVGLMENSTYTHNVGDAKNCYMVFDTGMIENCMYSVRVAEDKNMINCLEVHKSENLYECISSDNCNNIFYSQDNLDCTFSAFIYACHGCHNCICCSNLVNKSYYAFNKPISKEEYKKLWQKIFDGKRSAINKFKKEYNKMLQNTPRKNLNITNCENSIGHNIQDEKDVFLCEESIGGQNIRYSDRMNIASKLEDCMDISSWGYNMNNCYELNCCGSDSHTSASNCHCSSYLFRGVNNTQYSINIPHNSDYLFACTDIDGAKYCILNKQYTKSEYEKLISQIIEHMQSTPQKFPGQAVERGEFLDPKYSPFPYNDTIANDYYPIHTLRYPDGHTKILNAHGTGTLTIHQPDQSISPATLDLGGETPIQTKWRTREQEVNVPQGLEIINGKDLPDDIADVPNDITNKAIICSQTGRPFRITQMELDFYRKHGLPIPALHPDIRHLNRLNQTVFFDLHLRKCDNCGIEMLSVYKADTEFKVWCEKCYNKEIYG